MEEAEQVQQRPIDGAVQENEAAATKAAPKTRLRWYQYRLRSLLILMVLVSIGMSWFAVKMQRARRQKAAVEAIRKLKETVEYEWESRSSSKTERPGPAWLRSLLGDDFLAAVVMVDLYRSATDGDLEHLEGLAQLRELHLSDTEVTDTGLTHLKGLTQLRMLDLVFTEVTDTGLAHLEGLSQLQSLYLLGTKVTDTGLAHLKGLTQLQSLDLGSTQVGDAGLAQLKGLTQLGKLNLVGTKVTDTGLAQPGGTVATPFVVPR